MKEGGGGREEVADRLLALSERICREFVFFLCIFESRNCDISEDITELIKQILKLYEGLTERYRERVNWLEEDRDDNSYRCQPGFGVSGLRDKFYVLTSFIF